MRNIVLFYVVISGNEAVKRQIPHRLTFIAVGVIYCYLGNEGNQGKVILL